MQTDRLSVAYRRRLIVAGDKFLDWLSVRGRAPPEVLSSAAAANEALISFIQSCYDNGEALWVPTHAVLAMQTFVRPLKGRLRPAWDSISSWKLMLPVRSRTPVPRVVLEALRIFAVLAAVELDRPRAQLWWRFASVIGCGFWGLLRPKELFGLKRRHARVPGPLSLVADDVAVLTVLDPKNRASMGRLQVRAVRDCCTIR